MPVFEAECPGVRPRSHRGPADDKAAIQGPLPGRPERRGIRLRTDPHMRGPRGSGSRLPEKGRAAGIGKSRIVCGVCPASFQRHPGPRPDLPGHAGTEGRKDIRHELRQAIPDQRIDQGGARDRDTANVLPAISDRMAAFSAWPTAADPVMSRTHARALDPVSVGGAAAAAGRNRRVVAAFPALPATAFARTAAGRRLLRRSTGQDRPGPMRSGRGPAPATRTRGDAPGRPPLAWPSAPGQGRAAACADAHPKGPDRCRPSIS